MSEIEIRPAGAADAAGIAACVRAAYSPYVERIGQPPGPMLDDYDRVVREHLAYVIEEGGGVVARSSSSRRRGGCSSTTLPSCPTGTARESGAASSSTRNRRRAGSGTVTSISTPTRR